MGRLESEVVWKFPAAKCCLACASISAARFAERIAVSRVLVDALAQVVEQHAQLPKYSGSTTSRWMRAQSRSGCGGGAPTVIWMPLDLEGGEELDQPVLEGRRHAGGVGLQKQARQLAVDRRRDRGLFRRARWHSSRGPRRGARARSSPAAFLKTRMRTGCGVCRSCSPTISPSAWRNSSNRTRVSRPARSPASVRTSNGPEVNLIQRSSAASRQGKRQRKRSRRMQFHYPASERTGVASRAILW